MKPLIHFLFVLLTLTSCSESQIKVDEIQKTPEDASPKTTITTVNTAFQKIIDDAKLNGVILIFDPQKDELITNDLKRSEEGFLPASTFKVPNSMILMESGVVDENTIFKWDGKKRTFKMWERDFNLEGAFQKSCLPCYQSVTPQVGVSQMKDFLKKFDYGKMEVDSASMDSFWVKGNSKISAKGQIEFLTKFYNSKLPISPKTEKMMRKIMVIDEKDTYKLSGKTGWVFDETTNLGWFVGFIEKEGNVYFMATNVDPKKDFNMKDFPNIRQKVTLSALEELGII